MKTADRQKVLKSLHFEVPPELDRMKVYSIVEQFVAGDESQYFPIGQECKYIFDFSKNAFIYLSDEFELITGVKKEQALGKHIIELLDRILEDDQLEASGKLAKTAFEIMIRYQSTELTVNLKFNIIHNRREKRVLFQFKPVAFTTQGLPLIVTGHIVDITHWGVNKPARISIINKNELIYTFEEEDKNENHEVLALLNMKEIQLLSLKEKGSTTHEIAAKMDLKESAVYNMVREIKKKTNLTVDAVIGLLQ